MLAPIQLLVETGARVLGCVVVVEVSHIGESSNLTAMFTFDPFAASTCDSALR
jgi:hypothetical protein